MPHALIQRANEVLKELEVSREDQKGMGNLKESLKQSIRKLSTPQMQLSIFDAHSQTFEEIRKILEDIDINRLTPVEALLKLNEIKNCLK